MITRSIWTSFFDEVVRFSAWRFATTDHAFTGQGLM
jgi:hypothetical protein